MILRVILALLVCLMACERRDGADEPVAAPPNLVLISLDTTRPDVFADYGGTAGHTPAMDALAAESTVFETAVAPMGATFPSHATMLTGLYPRQHGIRANHDNLDARIETLTEILDDAGYDTAAFVSFGSMLSRGGFAQGFDRLSDPATGRSTGSIRPGEEITALALDWLGEPRKRPFFLWLHYFEAHAPYRLTSYAAEELADYDGPLGAGADVMTFYSVGKKIPWTDEERRALRALYDGEVRELDRLVAPVLEVLERRGLDQDTIVIVTADHGQLLGESDKVGHGLSLDEAVLRVPLIIKNPRASRAPARVAERVGLVDLTPTILDLAGLETPIGLDGRSLAGVFEGKRLDPRVYFAEMNEPLWDKDPTNIRRKDVAVYQGTRKAMHDRGGSRSFDLSRDPGALTPLDSSANDPQADLLEGLARQYHATRKEGSGQVKDRDVADELRALGYLE